MNARAMNSRGSTAPGRDGTQEAPGPDGTSTDPRPDGSQVAPAPGRSPDAPDPAAGARPSGAAGRPGRAAERRPDGAAERSPGSAARRRPDEEATERSAGKTAERRPGEGAERRLDEEAAERSPGRAAERRADEAAERNPDRAAGRCPDEEAAERRPYKAAVPTSRWRALAEIRALPSYLRLLVGTQLAFNVGFFAVLPYLAQHLGTGLGMAGWTVGLVLGLRTFSQQGLFVVGGALTDRFGPRPVVLAGCVLRIAGFVWLAFAGSTGTVVGAVLLIGFAAALFSPAVESETAREAVRCEQEDGTPRAQVLAVFSAAGQAGAFVGPLLGSLLLFSGFRAACLAGAAVFVAVLAGHWRLMPARPAAQAREHRGGGARALVRSPGFVLVCLAYSCYLVAYNQLYLSLPAEVERATGSQAALGWLFALSSLLVVCVQLPVTRWAGRRLGLRTALVAGLLVVAAGFLGVAVCAPLHLGGVAGLLPGAFLVVAITLGQMLLVPAARGLVPDLVDDRHLGLAMGALSSVSGLVVLVGSAATGALLGEGGVLLWGVLAAVPLAGAFLAGCLRRDGRAAG